MSGTPGVAAVARRAALLLPALVAIGCGGAPAPADPLRTRIDAVADDPAAASAVAAMLSAYGGWEAWAARHSVAYTYRLSFYGGAPEPSQVTRERHRLDLRDGVRIAIDDLDVPRPRALRLDGDALRLTRGGLTIDDPTEVEFQRVYGRLVRWDFLVPWVILDDGSRLQSRTGRTPPAAGPVPPGPCQVVRLRFDAAGEGGTTDDWHDLYISERSHLIEEIHTYRAAANQYRLTVWSDHRAASGVRVATRRATYSSDLFAAVGPLQAVAEYSDIEFDAPLDESTFRAGGETPAEERPGS